MPRKKAEPAIDPAVQAADTTSRRALIGGIAAALIAVVGGIAVAIINGWFSSGKSSGTPGAGIYRVRVIVIGDQKTPIEDAKVWSTFGGEAKKVAGGWQFDIPGASKPKDGKLTIYAAKEGAFLTGQTSLTLGDDANPAATIQLKRDDTARVRGQVVDGKDRAVAEARVFVVGYESEAVITKEGGNFELPERAAPDQDVLLHAEKDGLVARKWHSVGDPSVILKLSK